VPETAEGAIFKWVSHLTGSKNALKGAGFSPGGVLLGGVGFKGSLYAMAAGVAAVLLSTVVVLRPGWAGSITG
jgi:hypothetical protein